MIRARAPSLYDRAPSSQKNRHNFDADPEKTPFRRRDSWETEDETENDSPSSSYSSRMTSGSRQPMLLDDPGSPGHGHGRSRRYPNSRGSLFGLRRLLPSTTIKWICLGVFATMVIFILTLVHLSISSSRAVDISIGEMKSKPKPATWESFPFLERYYGGIRTLVSKDSNVPEYPGEGEEELKITADEKAESKQARGLKDSNFASQVFNPYPEYSSKGYLDAFGEKVECFLDAEKKITIPLVQSYNAIPKGFPTAVMGSNELLGIKNDMCFERFGRLGPYGLGYGLAKGGTGASLEGDRDGADDVWKQVEEVDYRNVKWAEVQERCVAANAHRFAPLPEPKVDRLRAMQVGATAQPKKDDKATRAVVGKDKLPKTAVVIRTWWDFEYLPEHIIYLRSLINELTLLSGGEHVIHFLIQVKDDNLPIWSDDATYERVLRDSLPEEFRGMGTLWTERQMLLMYGGLEETMMRDLPVHGVYRSTFMPMQYFAYQHPEYDFFWNWEMDVRYTGHWYHLFDHVGRWAKAQPRKGLWERNGRFYVPSVHGTWEDFRQMVRVQTEIGTQSANNMWSGLKGSDSKLAPESKREGDKPVWGAEPPKLEELDTSEDPVPPTTYDKDKYVWGVGEEADLIVFNPLYDPDGTTWLLAEDVTGYNREEGLPPRRTAIITASRLSRKLLLTMHKETALHHHTMFSEMWPASCALHHGFKAVYAPHSVYIDRRWPTNYLESVFNGGRNGASGGARTSVFGDREHNFRGTTWFYSAGFSPNLWKRWLGYRVDNNGGEEAELAGEGRMCLPPMLLHPVKSVDMPIEGLKADG